MHCCLVRHCCCHLLPQSPPEKSNICNNDITPSCHPPTRFTSPKPCLRLPASPPQNLVTFGAGLIVAFINGWKMSLVVLACLPLLIFAAAVQAKYMMASGSKVRYGTACCTAWCAAAGAHPRHGNDGEPHMLLLHRCCATLPLMCVLLF